jgi:hypothetical protein
VTELRTWLPVSEWTPEERVEWDEALALFDQGIPCEIKDPQLNRTLSEHRWGHHGKEPAVPGYCPACDRKNPT